MTGTFMADAEVVVANVTCSSILRGREGTKGGLPSSEQLRNVFGLSSVMMRFVMLLWQYHVRFVDPGWRLLGVYSTSESLMRLSPAQETILVLFVCGINFAEKMFPVCPGRVSQTVRLCCVASLLYLCRAPCGPNTCRRPTICRGDGRRCQRRDTRRPGSTCARQPLAVAACAIRQRVDASSVPGELVGEVKLREPCLFAVQRLSCDCSVSVLAVLEHGGLVLLARRSCPRRSLSSSAFGSISAGPALWRSVTLHRG